MAPPGATIGAPAISEVLSALTDGVALFDPDGRLIETNPAFVALNPGLAAFLAPGVHWDLFLREAARHGGYSDELCRRLSQAEADFMEGIRGDDRIASALADGRSFHFLLSGLSTEGFLLVQSAASGLGAEADAARGAEALLRKVLEASPISLTMSRIGDGQIIYRSPAATELLGTAKSSFAHFARRSERADFITALLPDGRVDDMQVTGLRADGSEFAARLSARLIDYGNEDVIVSSIEDLTEGLTLQAELERNREQLFQAEKMSALGELLAGVAHELNNPLSIIVGNAGILREDLARTSEGRRIDRIASAAERCVGIVRSFLSMARGGPLDLQEVPFSEVADITLEATTGLASSAGVRIRVDAADGLPRLVADRIQLAQVLINLVTNAVHAIQDAGTGSLVTLNATSRRADRILLRVVDDGPGIDEAIRGRVFDPLFTTKAPGKGTGVGLALCMRVVSAHGGTITLEPVSGRGAAFALDLPAA